MEDRIQQIAVRVAYLNAIKRYFRAKMEWIDAGCVGDSSSFGSLGVAATARHDGGGVPKA
jgi:hypothetical protein